MSRYARKVDDNQQKIVTALRKCGVFVEPGLSRVGGGVPDLLCGYQGRTVLLEVKDGRRIPSKRRLTPDEKDWHAGWNGGLLAVVESVEEAVFVVTGKRVELHEVTP